MSQQFYSIQLLNDLHNHFPELLYNQSRFLNIQDVLRYIRSVAEVSPYDRGIQQYNNRQTNNQRGYAPLRTNVTTVPNNITTSVYNSPLEPLPVGTGVSYNTIPINSTIPQTFVTMFDEIPAPQTARVRMPMNSNTSVLMNTLLGGLFGDIMGGNGGINLNTFLNERVPVFPTNEEIHNATTTYRTNRQQEDICAICQDEIESNQDVRRLTHCGHYFHQGCIDTWFTGNVHCPTCRHDIREVRQNTRENENRNVANRNHENSNDRNNTVNSNPPPVPENHRRMNIRRPDNS